METIVRVCAWYTLILFSITSLIGLGEIFTDTDDRVKTVAEIAILLLCVSISATGWHARKFGLSGYRINAPSKVIAAVSLIAGIIFLSLFAILILADSAFKDFWIVIGIGTVLILFSPVVVSAVAILLSKSGKSTDTEDEKKKSWI